MIFFNPGLKNVVDEACDVQTSWYFAVFLFLSYIL